MVYVSTPEKEVYRNKACSLIATTLEGELKIFPNHAPLLAVLKPGLLRIDCMPGCQCLNVRRDEMLVLGGFLDVCRNTVTVLADSIERSHDIDARLAEQAVQQASEQLRDVRAEDLHRAMLDMEIAMARFSVVKRMLWKH